MDITEFFRKLKCVCHWADPFKDLKWSNVPGVKLSSFSKSDGTFLSLQALSDLYYLFGGFLDYLWSQDLAFFLQKILCFVFRRSCVLSSKILRFASEALRFVYFQDLAFCLQRSCVLPQKHCVLSTSKILRFVSQTLRFVFKDLPFCFGSTAFLTSSTDSQMHNNIIAAGSRDSPPMLATRRYPGPYKPTTVLVQAVAATDDSPAILEHTIVETPMNMSPENKVHFQAEKEVIHLILTGIGDEIYLTVDACQTAQEMWEAIERLQQSESLNIQDVKTNIFWEFGKFTSHDGETRYNNDNQSRQFRKQRTVNVAGARENVGSPVV
nr:hypothetical protein [Tanacetum cinerariifolium]GEZ51354.1 hypothetical protein [Tanacetum cinerariifolium]GEZ51361.1 hypothetical protein [Tanacetum cinerariifolium]